jgi:hypothetical protein
MGIVWILLNQAINQFSCLVRITGPGCGYGLL